MENKVWLVVRERHTEDNDSFVVLGIYDNFGDSLERINEEYFETEEDYIEEWGENFVGENHNNGFAEFHVDDAWDETRIRAIDFEINKPTFEEI